MMAVRTYSVEVDETAVYLTDAGAEWWTEFRLHQPPGRLVVVDSGVIGDVVRVACDGREHAEWLLEHMRGRGMPKRAIRLRGGT